jgi:hypothetical protein
VAKAGSGLIDTHKNGVKIAPAFALALSISYISDNPVPKGIPIFPRFP